MNKSSVVCTGNIEEYRVLVLYYTVLTALTGTCCVEFLWSHLFITLIVVHFAAAAVR